MTQSKIEHVNAFDKAVQEYAARGKMVILPLPVVFSEANRLADGLRAGFAASTVWGGIGVRPQFILFEPAKGIEISDLKVGNQSQLVNWEPVPTSLYSIDEAMSLFNQSPDSPVWERFKLPLQEPCEGNQIAVHLRETVPSATPGDRVVRCYVFGKVGFVERETRVLGTLHTIGLEADGPFVQVSVADPNPHLPGRMVRLPVAPGDLEHLTKQIGRPVKFILSTEE